MKLCTIMKFRAQLVSYFAGLSQGEKNLFASMCTNCSSDSQVRKH